MITEIKPWEFDDVDLRWIDAALAVGDYGFTRAYVVEQTGRSLMQVWRVSRVAGLEGIVLTRVQQYPNCRVLEVWLLAGRGMMQIADSIRDKLLEYARALECSKLQGQATRKGLQKLYAKLMPVSKETTTYLMEV